MQPHQGTQPMLWVLSYGQFYLASPMNSLPSAMVIPYFFHLWASVFILETQNIAALILRMDCFAYFIRMLEKIEIPFGLGVYLSGIHDFSTCIVKQSFILDSA